MSSPAIARVVPGLSPAGHELRIATISDYLSFLKIEPLWNRLVAKAAVGHAFLEHAWARSWTRESTGNYWLFVFRGTATGRLLYLLKFRLTPLPKRDALRPVGGFALRLASAASRGGN